MNSDYLCFIKRYSPHIYPNREFTVVKSAERISGLMPGQPTEDLWWTK
jgi:hypothetical protein